MDFTLEELRSTLEEMGLENIPDSHLDHFAKDLKHLMKHEKHVQKRKARTVDAVAPPLRTTTAAEPVANYKSPIITGITVSSTAANKPTAGTIARPATCFYPSPPSQIQQVNFDRTNYDKPQPAKKTAAAAAKTSKSATTSRKAEQDKAKLEEAKWKKLRTDPVRLYGWYKTHWDFHGLE